MLAPGVCSHVANTTLPPLDKHILQFGKINLRILTNILLEFDKYILVALPDKKRVLAPGVCGHVANTTLPPLDKYILQFRQIHLQFEKIHFTILRNTFFNLDKYILLDKKRVLAPGVCSHVANTTLGEDSQGNSHGVLSGHQIHNRNFQNFYKIN